MKNFRGTTLFDAIVYKKYTIHARSVGIAGYNKILYLFYYNYIIIYGNPVSLITDEKIRFRLNRVKKPLK